MHGWREFLGEVGIIVVGVLIALGGEQVVESARWRTEVSEARETLNTQLAESLFASRELIKDSDCTNQKLDRLDAAIERDRPQINDFTVGSLRLWSTSAWDAAVSSGAVAHMAPEERSRYANLFAFTAALGEMNRQGFDTASDLQTLVSHPNLTDVSRDRLAQEISRLKGLNRMLTLGAGQWIESAKPFNIDVVGDDRRRLAEFRPCQMPDELAKN